MFPNRRSGDNDVVRNARADPDSSSARRKALAIYLEDHHAVARGGTALAQRLARNASRDIEGVSELAWIAQEISEDFGTLEQIMEAEGVSRSAVKDTIVVAAEHLGRLKLNGRLFGRARLSDVIELETLFVGITGKLSLWETLSLIGPRPDIDLDALAARARAQRTAVGRCRESASINAFRSPADPHPSVSPPSMSEFRP